MCAVATCDHANAPSASHAIRRDHRSAPPVAGRGRAGRRRPRERSREGQRDRDLGGATSSSRATSPPAVAASAPSVSLRRNAYRPEPREQRVEDDEARASPRRGRARRTAPSAAGRAIRPGGRPRTGTRPSRTGSTAGCARRRAIDRGTRTAGSQNVRMSGCESVSRRRTRSPARRTATPTTISAGPAHAGAIRRPRAARAGVASAASTASASRSFTARRGGPLVGWAGPLPRPHPEVR